MRTTLKQPRPRGLIYREHEKIATGYKTEKRLDLVGAKQSTSPSPIEGLDMFKRKRKHDKISLASEGLDKQATADTEPQTQAQGDPIGKKLHPSSLQP